MTTTNAQFAAAVKDLADGVIDEAAFLVIVDAWNQQLSVGGLAKRVSEQITRFDTKWSAALDLVFLGPLDLVVDLPVSADVGDTYWVMEAATGYPNGQAYVWIDGVWVAQGDRLTQGATGAGGTWGNIDGTLSAQADLQATLNLKLPTSYLDTDGTLAANLDTKIPSQKAVKAYVDNLISANDVMVLRGVVDCSANPNYSAADKGDVYRVSVAGKIGGASGPNVEAGDILLCLADSTTAGTHAAVGASWGIIQVNLDGALLTTAIGVTVQGYSAVLALIAGLTPAADRLPYFTGGSAADLATFTAAGRTLVAGADAAAQKTTLSLNLVDNTSDASKPVSTAQQAALDLKVNAANPVMTGKATMQGVITAYAAKTAAYTATTSDNTINCDTTSAGFTVTLPTAVGNTGLELTVKKIVAANTLTVGTTASQTIDGSTTVAITAQYDSVKVKSDGANWIKVGQVGASGGGAFTGGLLTSALGIIAGTVGAPGIYASGDTDTGRFFPAANTIADTVGGVEIFRLAANQATITGGTITGSKPGLLVTQTWNNSSVIFDGGLRVDITDTASYAGSTIFAARVGGLTKMSVDKTGDLWVSGGTLRLGKGASQVSTNTVFGVSALARSTVTGGGNVVIGYGAASVLETTIGGNVALGADALRGYGSEVKASGSVNVTAGQPADGDTFTVNGKVYTFQTTLTNVDGNVLIGAAASDSATNLKNAITLGAGSGTAYAAATTAHTTVTATVATTVVTITALAFGTAGNAYTLAKSGVNLAVSAATLSGGTNANTANYSVALGHSALSNIHSGTQNMAIGPFAMLSNTSGSGNCAVGYSSLYSNQGYYNTGIGSFSCQNGLAASEHNIGIGYSAAQGVNGVTTGVQNIFVGKFAGSAFTSGGNNICLGAYAGDLITTGSNNIIIGQNLDPPAATDSSKLNIGGLIKGDFSAQVLTVVGDFRPEADGTRNLGSGSLRFNTVYATTGAINTSDERHKVLREGGSLNAAELAAWGRVRTIVYQDKASYDEWGGAARLHVGYGWDAIKQAFAAEGLDAARYGLWCSDPVMAPRVRIETLRRPLVGEDGSPVTELRPLILSDGTPAMMDERKVVIDMIPTEVPVMEEFEETWLDVQVVDGEAVATVRTRIAERQATALIPVLREDGTPAMTEPVGVEGEAGYEPPKSMFAAVPKTQMVDLPVEREEVTLVPRMQEATVYETFEHEVVDMVPTGEVRGALRYSECAVFEAAWLRHQLATLTARVAALEA